MTPAVTSAGPASTSGDREREFRGGPAVVDAGLAVGVTALDLLAFWDWSAGRWPPAFVMAYAAVGGAALLARRRAPLLVLSGLWLHAVVALFLGLGYVPTLGLPVALHTVAALCPAPRRRAALGAAGVVGLLNARREHAQNAGTEAVDAFLVALVVFLLVYVAAYWSGRFAGRAKAQVQDLERRRAAAAQEAVAAERARLARELHDIISHSVSVMTLQAAGAKALLPAQPERAAEALGRISAVGTASMNELGRLLEVLRTDDSPPVVADSVGNPLGVSDLGALLGQLEQFGLRVTLTSDGTPGSLDPSVDLAVYRVVQEGLVNAAKHGGAGTRVDVTLQWRTADLLVAVRDDGSGTPAAGLSTGHGLAGLAERVRAVGGHLVSKPVATGGFVVEARLPVTRPGLTGLA